MRMRTVMMSSESAVLPLKCRGRMNSILPLTGTSTVFCRPSGDTAKTENVSQRATTRLRAEESAPVKLVVKAWDTPPGLLAVTT